MVLARLVLPVDFGLVGMVTALTGFLGLFRDCGLSMAAVQRATITDAQISTLFWLNLGLGATLAGIAALGGPLLSAFYGEPRLLWITVALGTSFLFNGAGAQHRAGLQRSMRFFALAAIDIISLIASCAAGICMALAGQGYWALVVMTVGQPAVNMLAAWLATRWVPSALRCVPAKDLCTAGSSI
jgi:PST family polysaccharide transporter